MNLRGTRVSLLLIAVSVFAQSDRGTVTGTVSDPAGALVANAPIELLNSETGAVSQAATSATGNYTLGQVPVGTYQLSVTVPGFKKFVRQNIVVQVGQTVRIDASLEVGAANESVTVTSEISLLKTETGDVTHNIPVERLQNLPVLGIGGNFSSSQGLRFYMAEAQLIPGAYFQVSSTGTATVKINGAPSGSQRTMIDGMDATNSLNGVPASMQPSVDAIQETAILTSDYSAEFGQVGGGLFNVTMKSGTNQYHGSAFDYWANEAFNAATPFLNTRPRLRRNDFGFSIGGPIWIPKVYNGRDKTFFFYNREQYREFANATVANTVPTTRYRNGDFGGILGAGTISNAGTTFPANPLGQAVPNGAIFDPLTTATAPNGAQYRTQFPNNVIPLARFDRVAVAIQSLIPLPTNSLVTQNRIPIFPTDRVTTNESVKLDHQFNAASKLSGYWGTNATGAQYSTNLNGSEGLPGPLTVTRGTFTQSYTWRINYDHTLSPTLLLHLGAGLVNYPFNTNAPFIKYDQVKELGLTGAALNGDAGGRFPAFATMVSATLGGMQAMGPGVGGSQTTSRETIPTFNSSLTWVRNNHTYKFGAELRLNGWVLHDLTATMGSYTISSQDTSQPYLQTVSTGAQTAGFAYASFLLGRVNQVRINDPADVRMGKKQWGFYVTDNWKVTRKFTLDLGLRYDYSLSPREQYGRLPTLDPNLANPSAGGHPGAAIYEATCNCVFSKNYPLAFGPRLGAAYQINSKTVLRAGFGISYGGTGSNVNGSVNSANTIVTPSFGFPVMQLQDGIPSSFRRPFPTLDSGAFPTKASPTLGMPVVVDQNGGRPSRQMQYSIGIQREIVRNLVVDASYVGNRGAWWPSTGANSLVSYNALTEERLASYGLNVSNAADRAILQARVGSPAAGRFFMKLPYSGFPTSLTVAQSLRPFPQFSNGLSPTYAPLGRTWYDSLQVKVTKRYSHGLDLSYAFTWAKELESGTGGAIIDVFNRGINKNLSILSRPLVSVVSATYSTPRWGPSGLFSYAVRDWTIGAVLQYASGTPIAAPTSNNNLNSVLFRGARFARVPGQPLFLKDLNCHCIDPRRDLALNPAAWTDAPAGQFGGSAIYFNDYRTQRRPQESMSAGRVFRIKERMSLAMRIEFTNIFNRTLMNNPFPAIGAAPTPATQTSCSAGRPGSDICNDPATRGTLTGGFGFISTASVFSPARSGTAVIRFTF